jgi:acylphosphatase
VMSQAVVVQPTSRRRYNRPLGMGVSRRYLIGGRVQGVGFRFFTEAAAAREGLRGWVRNLPDGRVEIEVEGDAEAVERFERHVRRGPPGARVSHVQVDETVPARRETGFSIR